MIKNKLLTGVYALVIGFMFSCDNTTADPINNNLNNPNNPGSTGGSAPTITGPRILHKIVVNNVTNQEFVTNGTVLDKAIFKEASGPNSFVVGYVTYTSGKITKVKFQNEVNGTIQTNSLSNEYIFTYDASGRINGSTSQNSTGSVVNFNSEYTYTYDASGKMTNILEKKKFGGTYTQFSKYNLTYTGENITKMVTENGMTSSAGVPDMSTVISYTYNFSGYDDKINPYTTLPKTFFVAWSLYHPMNFSTLSANNVTNFNIVYPAPAPAVPGAYTYVYDSQNYPVSAQSNVQQYVYKAL